MHNLYIQNKQAFNNSWHNEQSFSYSVQVLQTNSLFSRSFIFLFVKPWHFAWYHKSHLSQAIQVSFNSFKYSPLHLPQW